MICRLLPYLRKRCYVNSVHSGVSGPNVTTIVHNVGKFIRFNFFEIGIAILQSVLEWPCDKVDWSGKNADFSTLTCYHGNVY